MNLRCIKAPNELIPFTDPRIQYPMLGSIKFDGHRLVNFRGSKFITPSGKDHVNRDIPRHFADFNSYLSNYNLVADGELWSPSRPFNELQSLIRSHDKQLPDDVGYYVFDLLLYEEWEGVSQMRPYAARNEELKGLRTFPHVYVVRQLEHLNATSAEADYEQVLAAGGEGIMLRHPRGTYKHGRCTHLESHLFKFKNFITEDAFIVDFERMKVLRPEVERIVGPAGLLERTYRQEDYQDADAVGSFVVSQLGNPVTFRVKPGKGHTMEDRKRWWAERDTLRGTGIEFSHMPHGAKDLPRIGSLVRFRPEMGKELTSNLLPSSL